MYFDRPKDAFYDVEPSPLDTEAKDADDVTRSNEGSATIAIEVVGSNDNLQHSTRVRWAEPISTTTVIEPEAGEAVAQIASVTQSG
jgi:hypothetical protein